MIGTFELTKKKHNTFIRWKIIEKGDKNKAYPKYPELSLLHYEISSLKKLKVLLPCSGYGDITILHSTGKFQTVT
jgi:hypothetical protein